MDKSVKEFVAEQQTKPGGPAIISRAEHRISRANISENALKVLYRLKNGGYDAYLVGGGVRDLSLGREPKDFDIATDATPEDVRKLFRNCRLIGRRFRLAHVHFGREIIEVATYRARHDGAEEDEARVLEQGRLVRDNVFGTMEEDALRRDFTVNALYYGIADFSVVDYVGGMADLERGLIRLIGDAELRYREDPVRMLRAVRFAAKLGFRIHPDTGEPIAEMAPLLAHVPPARLFEEVLKLFVAGVGAETFEMLRQYALFAYLFPATAAVIERDEFGVALSFVARALENTDRRLADGRPITPAFLFAAMLWPAVRERLPAYSQESASQGEAIQKAGAEVAERQVRTITIPKRFGVPMREIWGLQPRLEKRSNKRAQRLLGHPRFRAAYDFLVLRAEVGDADPELARWWTDFQGSAPKQREQMVPPARATRGGRRRRRRGGGGAAQ